MLFTIILKGAEKGTVIPAKVGIQDAEEWIPACAGMTGGFGVLHFPSLSWLTLYDLVHKMLAHDATD